jgi:hypothetical protein
MNGKHRILAQSVHNRTISKRSVNGYDRYFMRSARSKNSQDELHALFSMTSAKSYEFVVKANGRLPAWLTGVLFKTITDDLTENSF